MAQQSQPVVPFNALKPATWGSLKLLPQALRSKLVGGKTNENTAFGKENAGSHYTVPQAPPKIGDLSHLQTNGPRRNVNQRYVLQPNLNVSRPMLANHAPGLSGLLVPAAPNQHLEFGQPLQNLSQQQQFPSQQRSSRPSTPSSPSLRGRQPQANPNFVSSNITTRLPTPVRINASPGAPPSPGNSAALLSLPKPPSPSRSLSQGGAFPANPFAYSSQCSSPAASTPNSNAFTLPMPPSIMGNTPVSRAAPLQQHQQASVPRGSQNVPWASGTAAHSSQHTLTTPNSVRPSPPVPERSILASVQLPGQNASRGATPCSSEAPKQQLQQQRAAQQQQQQHQVAADAAAVVPGISVSPVITVPAIQAALQQALQAALERKPETFKVDNFERMFDAMMHPGTATKLDGPLPHELPDDLRYSDNWYKAARDWNKDNKSCLPYTPPPSAAAAADAAAVTTPLAPTAVVEGAAVDLTPRDVGRGQDQEERQQSQLQSAWSAGLDEPPMSEACCKALDIAHHGLRKVLTPTARSRNTSATKPTSAPISLLDQFQQQGQQMSKRLDLEDTASSQAVDEGATSGSAAAKAAGPHQDPAVATTVAALTTALEALARDNAVAAVTTATAPGQESATGTAAEGSTGELLTPRNVVITGAAVGIRKAPMLAVLVDGQETPVVPMATTGASLSEFMSPMPSNTRPPSTAATTPGPRTPGGGGGGGAEGVEGDIHSVSTTAATTPARPRTHTSSNTPTGAAAGSRPWSSASAFELQPSASTESALHTASIEIAAAAGLGCGVEAQGQAGTLHASSAAGPLQSPTASDPGDIDPAVLWSPAFPPVAHAASMVRGAAAAAGALPHRPPSPVTLLQSPPREMPTPNPAFMATVAGVGAAAAGPSGLAAAVAAVAAPKHAAGGVFRDPAGPSTSSAPAPSDPLKEIVVGIEKLSTLKHNILAEDKEVDVASITQMIQLKLAVEQLLARTSTAAQAAAVTEPAAVQQPAAQVGAATAAAPAVPATAEPPSAAEPAPQPQTAAATPQKNMRTSGGGFGAFLKNVFSPRAGSASKATPAAAQVPASASRTFGTNITAVVANAGATAPAAAAPSASVLASPAATGVQGARPASASALPRHVASPSLADKSRYAALHQRAAARLAEAAGEPAGSRAAPSAAPAVAAPAAPPQRADMWRRYEEKIAVHRHQLDTTKSQLDEAVRKLNDMQAEFDELLLCLGMESAKNKALCDAMRAAGLDPEPILAAIEEQWMAGGFAAE